MLVFGTPVIAFALQAPLVENMEYGLAISAAVAALFYALTAADLMAVGPGVWTSWKWSKWL